MRRLHFFSYLLGATILLDWSAPGRCADPSNQALFNGKNLQGWDGDPRYWSVAEGVITGQTTLRNLPLRNTFLIWRGGTLRDFELRLKFRIQSGNSGVQYRSRDLGGWVVAGYQAEIENTPGKVGLLYEEKGRKFLAHPGQIAEITSTGQKRVLGRIAQDSDAFARYAARDWNEYFIRAQGPRVEHRLNGVKTLEFTDHQAQDRRLEGLFALQIHAGPPMRVEFKDIYLKNL
jgi:hypothetical protein